MLPHTLRANGHAAIALVAVLALASCMPSPAGAVIPHMDPIVAAKQMRHGGPLPPSVTAEERLRKYQAELQEAKAQSIKQRFHNAGPWELIAAEEFGVFAKPDAPAHDAPAPPSLSPQPQVPPHHVPMHPMPVPPTVAATSAPHPTAAASAAVTPPAAPPSPPASAAPHRPADKPTLSREMVMKLIKKYTDIIADHRAKRKAEEEKAKRIAEAAAAWSTAHSVPAQHEVINPHPTPAHDTKIPTHHRFGRPTHKVPPPPTHWLQHSPAAKKKHHVQFVLKFTGVCVDNSTATKLGAHHNPHNRQPHRHHLMQHRGYHAKAEPSREVPWCTLKAQSQEIATHVYPNAGVEMSVSKLVGAVARMDLFDVSILSETEFVARGNLSFGSTRHKSHSVAFESAGSARVFKFKAGERAFTAQFEVTDGEGGYDGHRGSVTLNGVLQSLNRIEVLATGVLYPPDDLQARRMSALKRSAFHHPALPKLKKPTADVATEGDEPEEAASNDDDGIVRLRV